VSTEHVDWPDTCLEAATGGEICAQVNPPGCRIVSEADGSEHKAHTEASGQTVRIVTS
jgi:hypothetical protein